MVVVVQVHEVLYGPHRRFGACKADLSGEIRSAVTDLAYAVQIVLDPPIGSHSISLQMSDDLWRGAAQLILSPPRGGHVTSTLGRPAPPFSPRGAQGKW